MSDDRFATALERFDAHLTKTDALLERNTQAFERNARAWGKTVSALEAIRESIDDMRDQIQANTRAILHVLDRLDNGGRTPPAKAAPSARRRARGRAAAGGP